MADHIKTWVAGEFGPTHCWTGKVSRATIDNWQRKNNLATVHVEVTAHRGGDVVTLETYYT